MEEKTKQNNGRRNALWTELQEKAKDDSEFAEKLKVALRVTERCREAFRRPADC